jgi:hypothetical protein
VKLHKPQGKPMLIRIFFMYGPHSPSHFTRSRLILFS